MGESLSGLARRIVYVCCGYTHTYEGQVKAVIQILEEFLAEHDRERDHEHTGD